MSNLILCVFLFLFFLDEHELKSQICRLQEYRTNGLKRLHAIRMYKLLRTRRNSSRRKRHLLTDVVSHIRVSKSGD